MLLMHGSSAWTLWRSLDAYFSLFIYLGWDGNRAYPECFWRRSSNSYRMCRGTCVWCFAHKASLISASADDGLIDRAAPAGSAIGWSRCRRNELSPTLWRGTTPLHSLCIYCQFFAPEEPTRHKIETIVQWAGCRGCPPPLYRTHCIMQKGWERGDRFLIIWGWWGSIISPAK